MRPDDWEIGQVASAVVGLEVVSTKYWTAVGIDRGPLIEGSVGRGADLTGLALIGIG